MNYIKEINAFYQRQETNPLSSHAANLWHTLMHVNNRAGWKKTFTVAVSVLCSKGNLSNSTFKRARIELHDKGYIHYKSRRGNQAAIYEITSLVEEPTINKGDEDTGVQMDPVFASKSEVRSEEKSKLDHNPGPLLKQNEIKQANTTTAAEAIHFFKNNFGKVSPYILDELNKWVHAIGQALVLTAMKRALERGKANFGYLKGILQSWLNKGFQTVEDTEYELLACRKQNQTVFTTPSPRGWEVVPDWFRERKKQCAPPEMNERPKAATCEELVTIIAKYA